MTCAFGVGCELMGVVPSGMWLFSAGSAVYLIFFSSIAPSFSVCLGFLFSFKETLLGCVVVDSIIDSRRSITNKFYTSATTLILKTSERGENFLDIVFFRYNCDLGGDKIAFEIAYQVELEF